MKYRIVKDYRHQEQFRKSLNRLAQKTFGLDFEEWYQKGYWREHYIPYSVVAEGEVVANVSVNVTDMLLNGKRLHFIQLGTVMTEEKCRHRGLIRMLMEEIERDYGEKSDGVYLFANDQVLGFYPKFGFRPVKEYEYFRQVNTSGTMTIQKAPVRKKSDLKQLEKAIQKSVPAGVFEMTGNVDLLMFYVTGFLREAVWYDKGSEAYVIAELEGGILRIHNIFSARNVDLETVIAAFGSEVKEVVLGFIPVKQEGYERRERKEEDCTLFIKGEALACIEEEKLMFPTLSHA